jgi:hypothetical protein
MVQLVDSDIRTREVLGWQFWRRWARSAVRLAPVGAARCGACSVQNRPRGISRLRQRLPRSQLGRCLHAKAYAQLVLGTGQSRSVHGHRLPHHGATEAYGYETQILYMLAKDDAQLCGLDFDFLLNGLVGFVGGFKGALKPN